MFKYTDNEQLKKELDKLLIDKGLTKREVAEKMQCKPQQLNNILKKRNLAFTDIQRILQAIDSELYIEIK